MLKHLSVYYRLDVGTEKCAYLYIRKNACSNFKRMVYALSNGPTGSEKEANILHWIGANAKIREPFGNHSFDKVICVFRDPLSRFHSSFLNQLLMKLVPENDVAQSISRTTNKTFEQIADLTLSQLVDAYLFYGAEEDLDGHFAPQARHLRPKIEHFVMPLPYLKESATSIFDSSLADRFFGHHVNHTRDIKRTEGRYETYTIGDMVEMVRAGTVPSLSSLVSPSTMESLVKFYRTDKNIFEMALNSAANGGRCMVKLQPHSKSPSHLTVQVTSKWGYS